MTEFTNKDLVGQLIFAHVFRRPSELLG